MQVCVSAALCRVMVSPPFWQVESPAKDRRVCHPFLVFRTLPGLRVAVPFQTGGPVWGRSDGCIQLHRQIVVWETRGSTEVRFADMSCRKLKRKDHLLLFLCLFSWLISWQRGKIIPQTFKVQYDYSPLKLNRPNKCSVLLCSTASLQKTRQAYGKKHLGSLWISKQMVCVFF